MSILDGIISAVGSILPSNKIVVGFPSTSLKAPYVTIRPLMVDPGEVSLDGGAVYWVDQYSIYCCGNSVESSAKLSRAVLQALQGVYVDGSVLSAAMSSGTVLVEGLYETHVIVSTSTSTL